MSIAIGGTSATGNSAAALLGSPKKPEKDFAAILEAFKKAASETPEQRVREAVLKKHDQTEESYQRLPQKAKEAIDREVSEAVKKLHERKTGVAMDGASFTPTEKLFG